MCVNCQNDNCNGCTEKFCTSDITCIQSSFQNINIPAGSTLTEVLELLEQYVNTSLLDLQNISITLGGDAACIGLVAGTYSYAQVFNAIISTLCDLVNATAPNTDTVDLGPSITLPACLSGFAGTTTTDLLEYISGLLCVLINKTLTSTQPYTGSNDGDMLVPIGIIRDVIKGITDNQSYMTTHSTPATDPNNFSIEVKPLTAVVNYYPIKRTDPETLTFNANKDVYVIMDDKAEITVTEQTIGDPEPSTTNKMLMYKILTSGTGVTSLTPRFETGAVNPTPLDIPDEYIVADMIKTGTITSDKLESQAVDLPGTYGQTQFLQFTVNSKGLVTAVTANFYLAGLANGDIIYYNAANLRFENKPNLSTGTNTYIPRSTGTNFTDSSIYEDANSIHSSKSIEGDLTGGSPVGDPNAAIVANGGPLLLVPMTAAEASALTPSAGYVVCVSDTNGTFTSVGFWGYYSGAWTKLG